VPAAKCEIIFARALSVPKEKLERAPRFDKNNWPDTADRTFRTNIYDYYGYSHYWESLPNLVRFHAGCGQELLPAWNARRVIELSGRRLTARIVNALIAAGFIGEEVDRPQNFRLILFCPTGLSALRLPGPTSSG
jgi:hypothetical protein